MTRTIRLLATIEFDYIFEPDQLESNLDGMPGDMMPTDTAMELALLSLDQTFRALAPVRVELDVAGPMYNVSRFSDQ